MKNFFITFFILNSFFSMAQYNLVTIWDRDFGGTEGDGLLDFQQTTDGGYILGGCSWSGSSGDKSQPLYGAGYDLDYWIIKTNASGQLIWERSFGGLRLDWCFTVQQTSDGGYIMGGYSYSPAGACKTQTNWDPSLSTADYWILKMDSLGNQQWDKTFGGIDDDLLFSIHQARDGGFILGGYSTSGVGGDKTEASRGERDYWIVKTDSLGNKEWDKTFGGAYNDLLFSISQTFEGGYILGGYSESLIGGDKTQTSWGYDDYWIVKIDSLGNKTWDRDFGGINTDRLYSLIQTSDSGFVLGGISGSNISGDKTQNSWGGFDYWILKLDSSGSKQWDKDFGGSLDEIQFGNVFQTFDGGFAIAGLSESDASGDKTQNNLSPYQSWVVKMDSSGIMQWDRTLLIDAKVEYGFVIQTSDSCYTVANYNTGNAGGDKTQNTWGENDYWIIKLCNILQADFSAVNEICPGTCTDFTNFSSNALSYQWSFPGGVPAFSTAINPINICYAVPGNYNVTLIASGLSGVDTLTLINFITVFPQPPAQAIMQSGDTLFANTGPADYQWYYNGNLISGATDFFYLAALNGDYNVVATDSNGCEVEAAIFNVITFSTLTTDRGLLTIYPNPVEEKLFLKSDLLNGTAAVILVYNMLGEMVLAVQPQTLNLKPETLLDVRILDPGCYFLELHSVEKKFRARFVKQ